MANKRIDEPTGTETVGHEWDGIEELDTPMPRWWLWSFYATIVWAVIYVILYPAWPLVTQATEGVLGWSSRGQLAEEIARENERKAPILAALAQVPIERLPEDSERMRAAVAGGRAAFKVNCVQCHGEGAAGFEGYPNLNDDDWLWGGDLKAIEYTLIHGIRQPGNSQTRIGQMPAFAGRQPCAEPDRQGSCECGRGSALCRQLRRMPWSGWSGFARIRGARSGRCDLALWRHARTGNAPDSTASPRRDAGLGQPAGFGDDQDAGCICTLAWGRRRLRGGRSGPGGGGR